MTPTPNPDAELIAAAEAVIARNNAVADAREAAAAAVKEDAEYRLYYPEATNPKENNR